MGRRCVGMYSNICVITRQNSCRKVVFQGCNKVVGSSEVQQVVHKL